MDENSREVRYTDLEYLSPKGVAEKLGFSSIDFVWKDVKNYRDAHKATLSIRTIARGPFYYTALESVIRKLEANETAITEFLRQYKTVARFDETKEEADKDCYVHNLLCAGQLLKADVPELAVKAMLSGVFNETSPAKRIVYGYKKLLDNMPRMVETCENEDAFLGDAFGMLLGTEEITTLYRSSDQKTFMTDSYSSGAPAQQIKELLKELWNYLNTSDNSLLFKALVAVYYIVYVQPFDSKELTKLLAVALGKFILAKNGLVNVAALLPLEEVLLYSPHFEKYEEPEIRRTGDITYFVLEGGQILYHSIISMLDGFQAIQNSAIEREKREIPKEELKEVKAEEEVIEEPKKERKPPKVADIEEATDYYSVEEDGDSAFSAPRKAAKSDKEVKEMTRYLLETHPLLRKAQASFYANHCTMGRYYTIQDFKRSVRCAYETARTSMDLLAEEKLYKKLRVKNKYVYTPIKQGD